LVQGLDRRVLVGLFDDDPPRFSGIFWPSAVCFVLAAGASPSCFSQLLAALSARPVRYVVRLSAFSLYVYSCHRREGSSAHGLLYGPGRLLVVLGQRTDPSPRPRNFRPGNLSGRIHHETQNQPVPNRPHYAVGSRATAGLLCLVALFRLESCGVNWPAGFACSAVGRGRLSAVAC